MIKTNLENVKLDINRIVTDCLIVRYSGLKEPAPIIKYRGGISDISYKDQV